MRCLQGRTEKEMTTHSSTLALRIPWTEEPGRLQFMGLLGVRQDWATSLSLFTFMHWRRKWQPIPVFFFFFFFPFQYSCLENPRDKGAWWAAVYGVAQSRTWLKQLSSSSSQGRNKEGGININRIRDLKGPRMCFQKVTLLKLSSLLTDIGAREGGRY